MPSALPYQDYIQLPVNWSGSVKKITMETGSTKMSGTVGVRSWSESATVTWVLTPANAQSLLNTLKSGMFNDPYTYTCQIRGAVTLRPSDSFAFGETEGGKYVTVSAGFDVV